MDVNVSPGRILHASINHEYRIRTENCRRLSMRKNELQVDGYTAPRSIFTTANEYFGEQYQLLQYMWKIPSQELGREEAEREEFALHALSLEEAQKTFGLNADSLGDSFFLSHPDPRVNNIIVDDELHIRGVIDWEFSVTVPRHAFYPRYGLLVMTLDRSLLSSQLAQDWDFRDDFTLPMAYIFLDPSNLVLLFYRCIYPRLYNESRDKVVSRFFQRPENKELQVGLVRRLRSSERYTQYLKDNNLFDDTEEPEWQRISGWATETEKKLQEIREWSDKIENELARLVREQPVQGRSEEKV